jgi:peptide deformylase
MSAVCAVSRRVRERPDPSGELEISNPHQNISSIFAENPAMALRPILEYPDPRLRTKAAPVTQFDAELATLVEDMFETMYAAPGIGLAATQVDVHKRVIVIDVSQDKTGRMVFINPEILSREGVGTMEEGCLSVPGIFDEVERAAKVRLRWHDVSGAVQERDFEEILAVCVQHEMDHLEGRVFVDYLSDLKRERIRKKLDKDRKERASRPAPSAGSARAY